MIGAAELPLVTVAVTACVLPIKADAGGQAGAAVLDGARDTALLVEEDIVAAFVVANVGDIDWSGRSSRATITFFLGAHVAGTALDGPQI